MIKYQYNSEGEYFIFIDPSVTSQSNEPICNYGYNHISVGKCQTECNGGDDTIINICPEGDNTKCETICIDNDISDKNICHNQPNKIWRSIKLDSGDIYNKVFDKWEPINDLHDIQTNDPNPTSKYKTKHKR